MCGRCPGIIASIFATSQLFVFILKEDYPAQLATGAVTFSFRFGWRVPEGVRYDVCDQGGGCSGIR